MIVCHCKGISDKTIRRAVREGAHTIDEVGVSCRAGTECGGCLDTIRWLIHSETQAAVVPAFGAGGFSPGPLTPGPATP
jgi:bacterioferritin-associated ferredoxin